jgi:hypothetical protein
MLALMLADEVIFLIAIAATLLCLLAMAANAR